MIGILDYGIGNIEAFLVAYKKLGIPAARVVDVPTLQESSHLVLPGVGSFDFAMRALRNSKLIEPITEMVFEKNVPILGVCVGMQMLATSSEEGYENGLNWISGQVRAFKKNVPVVDLVYPHMGWNSVAEKSKSKSKAKSKLLISDNKPRQEFYFLHSFYFDTLEKSNSIGTTTYGIEFDSVICQNNIFGVQFHPEKSHKWGSNLLKNFSEV